ncbi:uncharacterized protein LOC110849722 [Folsomia candida]|uniref:Germin-like protein subfamily 2 member 2 n=1 Tax=Folsomia candida TaxID=158441 RepID=A0A226E8R0_FOLCA|nr:uncharacterized protein LOC110849722 [Folsomia candida]XP_021952851.1 uncharacterized protein LOC110849722 [Folsomia candida]OXA53740.1 Germin-like protein subfamily 2 member 2 [Folsomia candida]
MSNPPSKDLRDGGCCTSSKSNLAIVMEQALITPGPNIVATVVHLTFPPGDVGSDPHTHPGPVVGYVLEGEFLFQVNEEPCRVIKAGEAFHEKDGDVHVWSANASNSTTCRVVATLWGSPGEPILTYVEGYPRVSREKALEVAVRGN